MKCEICSYFSRR